MAGPFPAASTLPLFRWRNAEGNLVDLDSGLDPLPRVIEEYRVDPVKWADERPARAFTPEGILFRQSEMVELPRGERPRCAFCNLPVSRSAYFANCCTLSVCRNDFRAAAREALNMVEIRDAGVMGKGVFATQNIPEGVILGEYLGELLPSEEEPDVTDLYQYEIQDVAICTSREFGNWTRFMNHRCMPNVEADVTSHYGGQRAVTFMAGRDIAAGEQLFISYGPAYFTGLGISCLCDCYEGEHIPPGGEDEDEEVDEDKDEEMADDEDQEMAGVEAPRPVRRLRSGREMLQSAAAKKQAAAVKSSSSPPWTASVVKTAPPGVAKKFKMVKTGPLCIAPSSQRRLAAQAAAKKETTAVKTSSSSLSIAPTTPSKGRTTETSPPPPRKGASKGGGAGPRPAKKGRGVGPRGPRPVQVLLPPPRPGRSSPRRGTLVSRSANAGASKSGDKGK